MENYHKIMEEGANKLEKTMSVNEFNENECEIGGNAYRDGFSECLNEIGVYNMVHTLVRVKKLIKMIQKTEHEEIVSGYFLYEVLTDIENSLKKAGV